MLILLYMDLQCFYACLVSVLQEGKKKNMFHERYVYIFQSNYIFYLFFSLSWFWNQQHMFLVYC